MKPPYAHVSQTALVVVAAAGAIWLSAFFLPGSAVQPVPLLPSIGNVAGKVVAVAEPHRVAKHPAARRHTIAAPVVVRTAFVPPATVPHAVQPRRAPRVVHRSHRTLRPHPAPKPKRHAPVGAAVPASTPASTPVTFYSSAPRGKAVGWHRKHTTSSAPPVAAPTPRHGKSHGHHDHGPPPRPAPISTTTPAAAPPATPPTAAGHDNGNHFGGGHDHGDNGHGPGGKK